MIKRLAILVVVLLFHVSAFAQGWQKPSRGAQLNRSHPLGGLSHVWLMNENSGDKVHDLANRVDGTLDATSAWGTTTHGIGVVPGAVVTPIGLSSTIQFSSSGGTLILWAKTSADLTNRFMVGTNSSTDDYFGMTDSNNFRINIDGAFNSTYDTPKTLQTNTVYCFGFTQDSAYGVRFYIDGIESPSGLWGSPLVFWQFNCLGNGYNSNSFVWQEPLIAVFCWDRVLSAAEIKLIYREPYCMFQRPSALRFFAPSGGAPPAVVPTPYYYRIITSWLIPDDYWDDKIDILPTGTDG